MPALGGVGEGESARAVPADMTKLVILGDTGRQSATRFVSHTKNVPVLGLGVVVIGGTEAADEETDEVRGRRAGRATTDQSRGELARRLPEYRSDLTALGGSG